jgi:hypothetical protein
MPDNTIPVLGEAKEAVDADALVDARIANRLASAQVDASTQWTQWYSDDIQALQCRLRAVEHDRDVWLAMTHLNACGQCNQNYGSNLCDHGKMLMETARPGSTKR